MFYQDFRNESLYASVCSLLCFSAFFFDSLRYFICRFFKMNFARVQRAKTMFGILTIRQVFKGGISVVSSGRRVAGFGIYVHASDYVKCRRYFSTWFARRPCKRDGFFRKMSFVRIRASLRDRSIFVAWFTRGRFATVSLCN